MQTIKSKFNIKHEYIFIFIIIFIIRLFIRLSILLLIILNVILINKIATIRKM